MRYMRYMNMNKYIDCSSICIGTAVVYDCNHFRFNWQRCIARPQINLIILGFH